MIEKLGYLISLLSTVAPLQKEPLLLLVGQRRRARGPRVPSAPPAGVGVRPRRCARALASSCRGARVGRLQARVLHACVGVGDGRTGTKRPAAGASGQSMPSSEAGQDGRALEWVTPRGVVSPGATWPLPPIPTYYHYLLHVYVCVRAYVCVCGWGGVWGLYTCPHPSARHPYHRRLAERSPSQCPTHTVRVSPSVYPPHPAGCPSLPHVLSWYCLSVLPSMLRGDAERSGAGTARRRRRSGDEEQRGHSASLLFYCIETRNILETSFEGFTLRLQGISSGTLYVPIYTFLCHVILDVTPCCDTLSQHYTGGWGLFVLCSLP